jgi:hypothetical protein
MKRAMKKTLTPRRIFGEFHTVTGSFQPDGGDTKIAVGYIEKIKV